MQRVLRVVLPAVLVLGVLTTGAGATQDQRRRMREVFTSPNEKTNSDLAFWGNHAFVGYYTGDTAPSGGVRIFDISNPASPRLVRDFACDGLQADPIVWDRNGNGVADLLLLAVDRTMANPECGAPRTAHDDPLGWEGVRVFEMSDNRRNPFTSIEQVAAVYTDCGAHTITAWPDVRGSGGKGRLLVYVSSYPLRSGPTCGEASPAPGDGYQNTANPYDEDPGSPNSPLHGVIQVVRVPFANPAAANELGVQPRISYPGDPDGKIEWLNAVSAPRIRRSASRLPPSPAMTSSSTSSTVSPARRARSRARCGGSSGMGSRTRGTRSRSATTRSRPAARGSSPERSTSSTR
jgi:hypothetical protein